MRTWPVLLAFVVGCGTEGIRESRVTARSNAEPSKRAGAQSVEPSSAQLVASALPHVLSVITADGLGSGFFIAEDLVVTCFHVVRGSSEIELKGRNWSGKATAVSAWNESEDLAVLRVIPARKKHGLHISRHSVDVGTRVLAISSPLGLENSVTDGLISAIREDPSVRYQFSAPISPGSSGGAVIDTRGEVVAVVSSTLTTLESGRTYGQNLNFAVPAAKIFKMLEDAHEVPVEAFAEQTVPEGDRRWKGLEASLPEIEKTLPQELGDSVARVYAAALRQVIKNHDSGGLQGLLAKRKELRDSRKSLLEVADSLSSTGARGGRMARSLITAWEGYNLNPSETSKGVLDARLDEVQAYFAELQKEASRQIFPNGFEGFPFMASVKQIHEYCYPGYTVEPLAGLASFECSRAPIPAPFSRGTSTMSFLNGQLVAIAVNIASYRDTVRTITEKYGQPTFSRFEKGEWYAAESASFALNTAFNWHLRGGRIRVGRLTSAPFVVFTKSEMDEAISKSF